MEQTTLEPPPPATMNPAGLHRKHLLLLALILVLAGSLRFYGLSRDAFWLDESFSLQAITGHNFRYLDLPSNTVISAGDATLFNRDRPVWTIWTTLQGDTFPPLYYLLLRVWVDLFGDSDFVVRFPSVLLSVAAVLVFFDVMRLTSGTKDALWGALVLAIAGTQIQMSREARAYALVLLMSLLACDAIVRIERFGPTAARLVGLGSASVGVMLSHYFAYGVIVALGLYAVIRFRGRTRALSVAALLIATLFVAITWGPFLREQAVGYSATRDFALDEGPNYFFNGINRLAQLPNRMLSNVNEERPLPIVVGLLFLLGPVVIAIRRRESTLWILLLVCVIGSLFCLDLIRETSQLHYVRYIFTATPALYALIVTAGGQSKLRWIVPPLVAFAAATSLPYVVGPYRTDAENWRAVAARINTSAGPNDVLVYHGYDVGIPSSRGMFLCISHYLTAPHPVMIVDDDFPSDRALSALAKEDHFWLISKHGSAADTFPDGREVQTFIYPAVCSLWEVSTRAPAKAQASPASGGSIPSAVASSIK
jgi:hypothetical protein